MTLGIFDTFVTGSGGFSFGIINLEFLYAAPVKAWARGFKRKYVRVLAAKASRRACILFSKNFLSWYLKLADF